MNCSSPCAIDGVVAGLARRRDLGLDARRQHRQRRRDAEHLQEVVRRPRWSTARRRPACRWPARRTSRGSRSAWPRRRRRRLLEDVRRPGVAQIDVQQTRRARGRQSSSCARRRARTRRSRPRPAPAAAARRDRRPRRLGRHGRRGRRRRRPAAMAAAERRRAEGERRSAEKFDVRHGPRFYRPRPDGALFAGTRERFPKPSRQELRQAMPRSSRRSRRRRPLGRFRAHIARRPQSRKFTNCRSSP